MRTKLAIYALIMTIAGPVVAESISRKAVTGDQVTPNYGEEERRIPGDNVIPHITIDNAAGLQDVLNDAKKEYAKIVDRIIKQDPESSVEQHPQPKGIKVRTSKPIYSRRRRITPKPPRNDAKIFEENLKYRSSLVGIPTITLPSHSSAPATINYGVKAINGDNRRLAVTLNYSFLGPNNTVVELTGCGAYVTVTSVQSTARLCGEVADLTCRTEEGQVFTIPFKAHLVDAEDNFECVKGVIVHNGKLTAGALAFLSDGTDAFGKAMAAAQVTTQVQTNDDGARGVTGSNVTGNKNKYIAGQTISGATGRFLNWHLDFYQSLQPTTEVGGGQKVFLYTDGDTEIPKIFFVSKKETDKSKVNTKGSLTLFQPSDKGGNP